MECDHPDTQQLVSCLREKTEEQLVNVTKKVNIHLKMKTNNQRVITMNTICRLDQNGLHFKDNCGFNLVSVIPSFMSQEHIGI